MKKFILIALMVIASVSALAQSWSVDKAHAKLGFSVKHLMISDVDGFFKNFDAKVTSAKDDFTDAVIELSADINSINTNNEKRDKDLRSPQYFDAEKYPKLTFKSKSLNKADERNYILIGDLTMHGVTKQIQLDVIYNGSILNPGSKKMVAGFKVTGKINRKDFNIANSVPGAMIGEEVTINTNAEFIKDE
ncbi:YceI family protein [Solitalea koreensis]|uniref:Polyisoprenoid-binding protein YceI n=1 Tax=Solitalea koreensis TaxID=543615 RepID=A0A521CJS9_9SPHI|nr:YceI family protein [Solitalea koreensis]SMO59729.1 Polyisoprenoid-binding protein YceI [Solitalea koreensis]